ncbi:toxin HicA [Niastella yeongjuensis]|uniref:Toxin HicA n=1 Tax=Niastella yeongjuensis TaxID=354355 RepID=A0A1V9ET51_9BACT|nr:toxin HicA [Niastella yeongjuensis]OQP49326.1 toxin HicA [Niastella yeongjuensis]SEP43267.1 hypothetical protein SAMN05660816_06085 [Niastella yeongjuensis]
MSKFEKLMKKLLSGFSDRNMDFEELKCILSKLEFEERIKGSHQEIINIQPSNGKAKPYQVKQVRELIIKYKLISDEGK